MHAVIDTDVWVVAVLRPTGAPARVLAAHRAGRFTRSLSTALLAELIDVLTRPPIACTYRVTLLPMAELIALQERHAVLVPVRGIVRISRGPGDDVVAATAVRGQADVIVSRDDDLTRDPAVTALPAQCGSRC